MRKRTVRRWTILLSICVVLLMATTAKAQTILDVYRDGHISDFNLGGGPLDGIPDAVGETTPLFTSKGILSNGVNLENRAIMTFDIQSFGGMTLSSAYLKGYGERIDNPGTIDVDVYSYSGDGVVAADDFNAPASFIDTFQLDPDVEPFQVDVKDELQLLLSSNESYVEYRLQADAMTATVESGEFAGNPITDGEFPGPRLYLEFDDSVEAVPEPATMMLFGTGLLGAAVARRRKKT